METSWADEEKLNHSDNTVENVIATARVGNSILKAKLAQNMELQSQKGKFILNQKPTFEFLQILISKYTKIRSLDSQNISSQS